MSIDYDVIMVLPQALAVLLFERLQHLHNWSLINNKIWEVVLAILIIKLCYLLRNWKFKKKLCLKCDYNRTHRWLWKVSQELITSMDPPPIFANFVILSRPKNKKKSLFFKLRFGIKFGSPRNNYLTLQDVRVTTDTASCALFYGELFTFYKHNFCSNVQELMHFDHFHRVKPTN